MDVRVRGRWTPEQRTYIVRTAKEQKATAGEILRFIIAWYLAHGHHVPQPRTLAPSPDVLVKRETGLKVLDFLTTADQAAAIKRAASGAGEAAWMRMAVESFKTDGPWSKA
jgi:hypothetical protein